MPRRAILIGKALIMLFWRLAAGSRGVELPRQYNLAAGNAGSAKVLAQVDRGVHA
jgi:hypothetical protein